MSIHTDLRDRCVALIGAESLSTSDAVDKVLADVDLDDETTHALVREGLRHLVNSALTSDRGTRPDDVDEIDVQAGKPRSGRIQHRPAQHELSARFYWLAKSYATVDGAQAPILQFARDDVDAALAASGRQAAQWQARERLWIQIAGEMESRPRARQVCDLPLRVLAELDALAGSALGGVTA